MRYFPVPTPWASHAFHPIDGYAQSLPYHIFPMIFPLHKQLYVGCAYLSCSFRTSPARSLAGPLADFPLFHLLPVFVFVNCWSIFIHDSDMITGHFLETIINGPAHHTLHHMYFTVNYGQYFTFSDKAGGSYRQPESELDPMLEVERIEREKEKRAKNDLLEIVEVVQEEDPTQGGDVLDGRES